MTQLLIPLANFSSDKIIKEEIIFNNISLIEKSMESFVKDNLIKKVLVVIHYEIFKRKKVRDSLIKIFKKKIKFIIINNSTDGATCTSLLAIDNLDFQEELIITSLDQMVNFNLKNFLATNRKKRYDSGVVCFNSIDPRWSYVLLDKENNVKMFSEKRPISNVATAGVYYFKTAELFVKAAKNQIFKRNTDIRNIFYISSIFNEIILLKKKIFIYLIEETNFDKIENVKNFKDIILNKNIKRQKQNLTKLTKEYVKLFNMKNSDEIAKFFNDESSLIEVGINEYYGKEKILSLFKNVFKNKLNLKISNITPLPENNMTILEFNLSVNNKRFVGNDLIFWKNDKIQYLKAYFYEKEK